MSYIEEKIGKLYREASDKQVINADDDVQGVGNKAVKTKNHYKNSERDKHFMNNTEKMRGSATIKHFGRDRRIQETTQPAQNLYLLFNPSDFTNLMTYLFP